MTAPMAENPETVAIAIRNAWVAWAKRQPNPKPHWLVPWAELDEPSREADRAIAKVFFKLSDGRVAALEARLAEAESELVFLRDHLMLGLTKGRLTHDIACGGCGKRIEVGCSDADLVIEGIEPFVEYIEGHGMWRNRPGEWPECSQCGYSHGPKKVREKESP